MNKAEIMTVGNMFLKANAANVMKKSFVNSSGKISLTKNRLTFAFHEIAFPPGSTSHYFIEFDKKGKWSIGRRMIRWHALPGGNEIVDFPGIYSVEQIEDNSDKKKLKLVFKDKSGQIVFEY